MRPLAVLTTAARDMEPDVGTVENMAAAKFIIPRAAHQVKGKG